MVLFLWQTIFFYANSQQKFDLLLLCQMCDINSMNRWRMPWHQTGATQSYAQFRLPDRGRAIKWFVFCNIWDLEPLDLLKQSGPKLLSTVP